ncbi:MAG: sulfatase-like hydrolase/transferase [Acidobacteria bacterium]|nr:sulfatase-like hydrolase/transferase [Acidobacteriota bacterium]
MATQKVIARREFIKSTAAGVTAAAISGPEMFAAPAKKPNILLIMSDEHNPFVTGAYGNRIVHTPNIDGLAADGITFENHYCNSPLCSPSRMSFTAGKYVSRVSAWNNRCDLPNNDIASLPRVMTAAGYDSVLCGKMHYDRTRRYGWTEAGGNFNKAFKDGLSAGRWNPEKTFSPVLSPRFEQFHPGENSGILNHDRKVTKGAVEFLSQRKDDDKPFFLLVGYLAPHFPLIVPEEWDKYKGKIAMPEIPKGFLDQLPTNYKTLRAGFEMCTVPSETVKRGRELYYGLTSWFDNEMGKVLSTLRANKEMAENTIIIYTSDHGENMGEHGMWWKNTMYEQSAHVPTIISWPKKWKGNQRRKLASSHVDLVRTIIDMGGGKAPTDWNGSSMVPWMNDPSYAWKDFALSEYYAHNVASGYVMVRTGPWKYTYHNRMTAKHGPERELYDLATDPKELNNLAAKPEHAKRIAAMHAMMLRELRGKDPEQTELQCRKELSIGYRRTDKLPTDHVSLNE